MKRLRYAVWLIPGLVGYFVFYILPYKWIIIYALTGPDHTISFSFLIQNYRVLVRNEAFRLAVSNTSVYLLVVECLALVWSLLWAKISMLHVSFGRVFRAGMLIPFFVPTVSLSWLDNDPDMIFFILLFVWKYSGLLIALFFAALSKIDIELIDAARIDGAGRKAIFLHIELPELRSAIEYSSIIIFIYSFRSFRDIHVFTGDYPSGNIYMISHFLFNSLRNMQYTRLSAAALLIILFIFIVVMGYVLAAGRKRRRI